jgi:galactitol-specific phosphotransferase system IIC component
MKGTIFLMLITTIMFIISTLFIAIDFASLIIRLKMTLNANMMHTLEAKATWANHAAEKLQWLAQITFVFGVCHLLLDLEHAHRHLPEAESE